MKNRYFEDPEADVSYDELPADVREQFEAIEEAYRTTEPARLLDLLVDGGYEVRPPDEVPDAELAESIAHIAEGLALLRVYLESTNHLSDRELYELLWNDALIDPVIIFPKDPRGGFHLDLVSSGDDDATDAYLRYYASEETRQRWKKDFDVDLPPKEEPPFDRDRFLPQRKWDVDEPVEH